MIHTVGPVYGQYGDADAPLLASCHRRSLEVALECGARSVAFPAISCGVYGYPAEEAAPIAVAAVREVIAAYPNAFDLVRFVLSSERLHSLFAEAIRIA